MAQGKYYVLHSTIGGNLKYSSIYKGQEALKFYKTQQLKNDPLALIIFGEKFDILCDTDKSIIMKGSLTDSVYHIKEIDIEQKKRNPEVDRIMRDFDQVILNLRKWVEREVD